MTNNEGKSRNQEHIATKRNLNTWNIAGGSVKSMEFEKGKTSDF